MSGLVLHAIAGRALACPPFGRCGTVRGEVVERQTGSGRLTAGTVSRPCTFRTSPSGRRPTHFIYHPLAELGLGSLPSGIHPTTRFRKMYRQELSGRA